MIQIPLLEKLYTWSSDEAVQSILDMYTNDGYSVVNYLYFANAMKWKLFEEGENKNNEETTRQKYSKALEHGNILLPDGIALELFYRYFSINWVQLTNLNWTDFLPYFLQKLWAKWIQAEIIIYGTRDEYIQQLEEHYGQYFPVIYAQDWYREFNWSQIPAYTLWTIRLLLVGRWSPLQEIWADDNREQIKKNHCLVMNQWWTFEFAIWVEHRAPNRVIKARVLETFRRIATNPRKNLKKFVNMFGVIGFLWRRTFLLSWD